MINKQKKKQLRYQVIESLPSSGFENWLKLLAQATDILTDRASKASSTMAGFNQSSAAYKHIDKHGINNIRKTETLIHGINNIRKTETLIHSINQLYDISLLSLLRWSNFPKTLL